MDNRKNSKQIIIWLSVLILFICVAVTTFAFTDIMNVFWPDDSGAIELIPTATSEIEKTATSEIENDAASETENESTSETESAATTEAQDESTQQQPTEENSENAETIKPSVTTSAKNPGFQVSDDRSVWTTNAQIEIFKLSYENGEQVITVKSDNGDNIIAPGTKNSYAFKLKNTGNVALDYTVELEAYIAPSDVYVPITGRINRYDGTWVAGDKENYVQVSDLNGATDNTTLGAGKYIYYTLDWLWPFENGSDHHDTLLGNMANVQDITFTIVIKTTATESSNPYGGGGITSPSTGDQTQITIWFALMFISFIIFLFLGVLQRKGRWRCDAEEENF